MKLIARTNIRHDGKRYAEGDALDVKDKKQAQALIDCGAADEEAKAEPAPKAKLAAAEKAVADAKAALAAAAEDAKAAAQKAVDEAEAALKALTA